MSTIVLAYDGSTHADWVARYAIRLARASGEGLQVVHVADGALADGVIESRLARLGESAAALGVEPSVQSVSASRAVGVAAAIDAAVPVGRGHIIVSGLRARKSARGLLRGTVSDQLLRSRRHHVLAVRVVSPSLLGHARHVLLSLSQNPAAADRAGLFVSLLAPELTRLSLLTVMSPRLGRLARPTPGDLHSLRARGRYHLRNVEALLRSVLSPLDIAVDPHVAVSWDWASEITRYAARARAELILVGATERTLAGRLVFGNPLERVLYDAVCDVAIFRRASGAAT